MKKHRGGTLLGFVLGLLVGLGAALAVAVYVYKGQDTLVKYVPPPGAVQDAREQERNRDWNPNAGLASKSVPQPKPVEAAATPTPTPAPAPAPAPASVPAPAPAPAPVSVVEPGKPAPVVKPQSKDPLGELIESRIEGNAANAARTDSFIYFLQAGAFRAPEEAESQRARLAMQGFDFKVSEREQAGRLIYRLRLGPFRSKAEVDQAQERLVAQGVEVAQIRSQR